MANEKKTTIHSIQDFFTSFPPNTIAHVATTRDDKGIPVLTFPDIELYCAGDKCAGLRYFRSETDVLYNMKETDFAFILYSCRNCAAVAKIYAIQFTFLLTDQAILHKVGETPAFGPHTPSRLMKLIGPDRELYLKGRRAESIGLGIGAFSYYRRVVENQKNRIFEEIKKIALNQKMSQEIINDLENAKNETQFSKAVEHIKHALPQSLLVYGNSPLLLLHSALSEGLHAQSDEQCLEVAQSIRVVLTDLSERVAQALRDDQELKSAVTQLLNPKNT